MSLPRKVNIVEVGPRDGLQNESKQVPTDIKLELIRRLSEAGHSRIEATSFVSPKWIPQMADAADVMIGIKGINGPEFSVLTPNLRGFENALTSGATEIEIFGAASESFSQKNINCAIEESLEKFKVVAYAAKANNVKIRGSVSCCLGCPYEGDIAIEKVVAVVKALYDMGCYEVAISDTIGVGTPEKVKAVINAVKAVVPIKHLAVHFHDTYGQALANIYAALQCGISTIDSSVAGLGGCPYAKGAAGNVATDDVVFMLNGLGIETGIDLDKLIHAGHYIMNFLGRAPTSKVSLAALLK
jgi:isopropylmalate/homocitrate/citramalate synthase